QLHEQGKVRFDEPVQTYLPAFNPTGDPRRAQVTLRMLLTHTSVGAFGPVPWQASYGAAKAFVLSYTEAMAGELKGTGVTAAVVCPGPVRTGFGEAAGIPDDDAEKLLPKFLWEEPDVVARTAVDGLARGRRVIVPGVPNRFAAALNRLAPRWILLPMLARRHPGRAPR
ncbi:SDR family oxidoreductase, partial [Mycobacterium sp. NAZ190054]|uniref:SDR family NAD(P)-dependent oxidoreductase n=1 Tax=Mycobacterium sp. NAZ190054 TaxID=1747766 RepID=UPI000A57ECE9